jgi:hypothetical protein
MTLQAARFRDDPVLQACADGQHRMVIGEPSSGSVRLIQQALIDAGYPLPKFGPDGKYGKETADAVAKYKAERPTPIVPSDGVVGPKTMAALDEQFKNEPQPLPPLALGVGEVYAEEYILAVKDAEAAYPGDTPEQMLTRIRQMYYPGTRPDGLTFREAAFDELMQDAPIREAGGKRRLLSIPPLDITAFSRLTDSARENAVPPAPPDNPGPYLIDAQEQRVDIGHALLTIDALVHTTTGHPYVDCGIPSIDPASWVGDIGIAAVWTEQDGPDAPRVLPKLPSGEPDCAGYFKLSAPDPDLLGDIDGFCILELWKSMGGTLSDVLMAYYLGSAEAEAFALRRFRTFTGDFCGDPDPSGPTLFPGLARAFWLKRINRFCDLYAAGPSALLITPDPREWRYAEQVLDRFLSWLYTGLKSETALHP